MKLSIITVNLNNADGLKKTIESVIEQTFTDYEYLIIDGGSTDGSVDVIKQYAEKITYWVSEPDTGIYNAMNKGILRANGEYCLFLNSGDYLYDEFVLAGVFYDNNDVGIIYGNLELRRDDSSELWIPSDILTASYLFFTSLPHPAAFIKRELLLNLGMYDEAIKISADHDFFLKAIIGHHATYCYIKKTIAVFYMDGISNNEKNKELIMQELQHSFKTQFPAFYDDYRILHLVRNDSLIMYVLNKKDSKVIRLFLRCLRKIFR